jgi:hypothetical protein
LTRLLKPSKKIIERIWNDGEQFETGDIGNKQGNEMDPVMLQDYADAGITSRVGVDCDL